MILPEVGVVIAVYRPDLDQLDAQLASLSAQQGVHVRLLAVVADRQSGPLITDLAERYGLDVELAVPETPSNSYDSFGLGLEAALAAFPNVQTFAFSDQDDVWMPTRLNEGLTALQAGGVALVHSDARVIDQTGEEIAPSLHRLERRWQPASFRDLLLRNAVTGMTAIFTRRTAEAATPFPRQAALFFHHDLWIALVAYALGDIRLINVPLVDYRQHERNVVGAGAARRPRHVIGGAAWRRHWGGTYYVAAYLAKSLYLRMTELAASGAFDVDRSKLAALRPYLSERGLGAAHLSDAVRMTALGRLDLAAQSAIFCLVRIARAALAIRNAVKGSFLPALTAFDRRAFLSAPGVQPGVGNDLVWTPAQVKNVSEFADRRLTPSFDVSASAEGRRGVLVLVPSLNPGEIFAGIATAIDLGLGLAELGHDVTLLATDLPIGNPGASRDFILSRSVGGPATANRIDLVCGRSTPNLAIAKDCTIVATAWWTAHIAKSMIDVAGVPRNRFFYLVQDYEPGFYPWGAEFAGALASYHLGATPVFNCIGLKEYFGSQGLFLDADPGLVFHPSIDVGRYASLERPRAAVRRLAVYGRPEVPRNLFPTGLLALDRFLAESGLRRNEIDLVSVGLAHDDISFSAGHILRSAGKIPWVDYPGFLAGTDVGLSLMLSPHPSHLPIEMAAAGARVVTNSFGGKDLSTLSPAIQSVEPAPGALAQALRRAWSAPPVAREERQIELARLGQPLPAVVAALSDRIRGCNVQRLRYA